MLTPKMRTQVLSVLALLVTLGVAQGLAANPGRGELRTSRYLDSIRNDPSMLLVFTRNVPKGADLHNHLSGAVYAESYVQYAAEDGDCVDETTMTLLVAPCDPSAKRPAASEAFADSVLYSRLLDAFSMRQFIPGAESGHDHFFATFGKFSLATEGHTGAMLAEVADRAAADHLIYLELMFNPDEGLASKLGGKLGWDPDFGQFRSKLLAGGMAQVVAIGSKNLDNAEARMREDLHCGQPDAHPGCAVTVRYLYQVSRGLPPQNVFAQIVAGFEMAKRDPRVVGLNLVMPEDGYISMRDFTLHMKMLDYLHRIDPQVHITLHAGEITPDLVPPEGLRFHIRQSVELGHAERIGHGVDVMHEDRPIQLLKEMAQRHVLVEICLTSNAVILGVRGKQHPFPVYLHYGVPVALATDDEGVSRSDMNREYLRAIETYNLSYLQLKKMIRDSLDHAFLPGASLWRGPEDFVPLAACSRDQPGSERPATRCNAFLASSQRARLEWKEEGELNRFERQY
ncbi:MAG: adenosine deaminase family protein [Terriglobia bacterium]